MAGARSYTMAAVLRVNGEWAVYVGSRRVKSCVAGMMVMVLM